MVQITIPNAEQIDTLIELLDKRNIVIASVSGVGVEAGTTKEVIAPLDISKFPIQYVTSFADARHYYDIEFFYRTPTGIDTTHGVNTTDPITIYESENKIRGASEWVESKGGRLKVNIRNNDEIDHVYDLVLYGVR